MPAPLVESSKDRTLRLLPSRTVRWPMTARQEGFQCFGHFEVKPRFRLKGQAEAGRHSVSGHLWRVPQKRQHAIGGLNGCLGVLRAVAKSASGAAPLWRCRAV